MFERVDLYDDRANEFFSLFELFKKAFIDYTFARRNVADYKLFKRKFRAVPNGIGVEIWIESKVLKNAALFLEDFDSFVAASPEYAGLSAMSFELDGIKKVRNKASGEMVYRVKLSYTSFFDNSVHFEVTDSGEGGKG